MNRNTALLVLLSALALVAGCAPGFEALKSYKPQRDIISQYRINANGNDLIESPSALLDSVLYERKLNGAIGAQPIGNDQILIVPTFTQRIYFVDPNTGKDITYIRTKAPVGSAVALNGVYLYYVQEAGADLLTCMDVLTGRTEWSFKVIDPQGAPIIKANFIYLTSRLGKLFKLNRDDGTVIWKFESTCQFYSAPAVAKDKVVVGNDKGEIIALNDSDGNQAWSFKTDRPIYSQPLIDDRVYCGSGDGNMYALDVDNGKSVWNFKTEYGIHSTPVKANGRLFFGSDDKFIYCLDPIDGKLFWKFGTDGIIQSSPIFLGNTMLIGNSAGDIYQFAENGTLLKTEKVKGSITAPFTVIGDKLFVVTRGRYLYAYRLVPPRSAD